MLKLRILPKLVRIQQPTAYSCSNVLQVNKLVSCCTNCDRPYRCNKSMLQHPSSVQIRLCRWVRAKRKREWGAPIIHCYAVDGRSLMLPFFGLAPKKDQCQSPKIHVFQHSFGSFSSFYLFPSSSIYHFLCWGRREKIVPGIKPCKQLFISFFPSLSTPLHTLSRNETISESRSLFARNRSTSGLDNQQQLFLDVLRSRCRSRTMQQ